MTPTQAPPPEPAEPDTPDGVSLRTGSDVHGLPDLRDDTMSPPPDIVDEWGLQSFPASDPPSNW